jgi:hypothetical protein
MLLPSPYDRANGGNVSAMLKPLTLDQFVEAADGWTGRLVAARIVTPDDDLIAVFRGELGPRSDEKHPALFWPLILPPSPGGNRAEKPGLYLHPDRFDEAAIHMDKGVLELQQGGVTLNLRRL